MCQRQQFRYVALDAIGVGVHRCIADRFEILRSTSEGGLRMAIDWTADRRFQAVTFVAYTICGAAVTVLANAVMNSPLMISSAAVVGTGALIFLVMVSMEVGLDWVMDLSGETRLIAARRFTGRPRDLVVNACLTGFGIVMVSYSMKATRTPLPLQVTIQLLSNLVVAPAKIVTVSFQRTFHIFGGSCSHQELLDVRDFWINLLLASAAFITATALTLVDRVYVAGAKSGSIQLPFVLAYSIGSMLMTAAQIHADATLSKAAHQAAWLHRRSTRPSTIEQLRQGLSFGCSKQLWRCVACIPMLWLSVAVPGLDTADTPVTLWSTRRTLAKVFSFHDSVLLLFIAASALQAALEPLMNAQDASLTGAAQNTQSAILIVAAWIPQLTLWTAGYSPSVILTVPALVLVLYGSIPLARYSEIVQRYQHGAIARAGDEETALEMAEASRPGSSWDLGGPLDVPPIDGDLPIGRTGLCRLRRDPASSSNLFSPAGHSRSFTSPFDDIARSRSAPALLFGANENDDDVEDLKATTDISVGGAQVDRPSESTAMLPPRNRRKRSP
jgi:hypothetical protein